MTEYTALIIDDEPDIRTLTAITLERLGIRCFTAEDTREAIKLLNERRYHFCLTDMKLPDGNGLEIINLCQKRYPEMPIAMITAYGNLELGVSALKAGAFDVVAKPIDTERLRDLAKQALRLTQTPSHIDSLPSDTGLIGKSEAIVDLKNNISKIARTQAPVFIKGESGCGKGLVAQLIHHQSSRKDYPFVTINCVNRDPDELEADFFSEKSLLLKANRGTLFINGIEQLSSELQNKLLTVLDEKVFTHTFSGRKTNMDFRIVSASTEDLTQRLQDGTFRPELFFRIHVIPLAIPPLRQRLEDVPVLVNHFIKNYVKQWGMPQMTVMPDAMQALQEHDYPGNISELKIILQKAVALTEEDSISAQDLLFDVNVSLPTPSVSPRIITHNLEQYLEDIERSALTQALESTRGNKTAAAAKLGISFRTLRYRCKKLGID